MAYFRPRPRLWAYVAAHPRMQRALYPWARRVQARAVSRAPEDTGRLKSRIRIVPNGLGLSIVSDARNPKDGFPYAVVQERRRPYLRPAIRK